MSAKKRSKMSEQDWLMAAYEAMIEGGLQAIAVESLARTLGVTKGSFYWHFKNRDALLEGLVVMWEELGTRQVIARLDELEHPEQRLLGLITVAWDQVGHMRAEAIFQAAAAHQHPIIGPAYARITRTRLAYTTSLYEQMGMKKKDAIHWGRTAYGAFLGTVQLVGTMPELWPDQDTLDTYVKHLQGVLLFSNI